MGCNSTACRIGAAVGCHCEVHTWYFRVVQVSVHPACSQGRRDISSASRVLPAAACRQIGGASSQSRHKKGSASQGLPAAACRQMVGASSLQCSSLAFQDGRLTAFVARCCGVPSPLSTFRRSLAPVSTVPDRAHPRQHCTHLSSCMSLWKSPACMLATQQLAAPSLSACPQLGGVPGEAYLTPCKQSLLGCI